ncbi:hypothetical protein D3C75_135840 [compost metagenome]
MSTMAPITWDTGKVNFQQKLGQFVQFFQVNLPVNGYGIPLQMIDPARLAEKILDCQSTDDLSDEDVDTALWDIIIDESIPTIDGVPVWERLDGEGVPYYNLFKEYREALYATGSRAVVKVATAHNILPKNLTLLSRVYHWQLRARAYDQYKKYEAERKRIFEVEKLESKHLKAADRLLEQAMEYFENHPEQLDPKTAVQMLQTSFKMARLSVGLHGDKPGTGAEGGGTTVNITQSSLPSGDSGPISVNSPGASPAPSADELNYLQSVMSILDRSGAMDKINVVEAEYSVVDEEDSSE